MSDPLILNVTDEAESFERNVYCNGRDPAGALCRFGWNGSRPTDDGAVLQANKISEHLAAHPDHTVSIADTRRTTSIVSVKPASPVLSLVDLLKGSDDA